MPPSIATVEIEAIETTIQMKNTRLRIFCKRIISSFTSGTKFTSYFPVCPVIIVESFFLPEIRSLKNFGISENVIFLKVYFFISRYSSQQVQLPQQTPTLLVKVTAVAEVLPLHIAMGYLE